MKDLTPCGNCSSIIRHTCARRRARRPHDQCCIIVSIVCRMMHACGGHHACAPGRHANPVRAAASRRNTNSNENNNTTHSHPSHQQHHRSAWTPRSPPTRHVRRRSDRLCQHIGGDALLLHALAFNPLVHPVHALVPHFNTSTGRRGLQLDDTCRLIWEPFPVGPERAAMAMFQCAGPLATASRRCHDPAETATNGVTYQPVFEDPCDAELGEAKQCRHLEFRHLNITVNPISSTVTMRFKLFDATNALPVPDLAACKFEVLAGDNYRP